MIRGNPRGKKTKFSSSFYTLFHEGTDNKHEDQFKGRPTAKGYQSTLRLTRTWFPTLSRYGTRPSLDGVDGVDRKDFKKICNHLIVSLQLQTSEFLHFKDKYPLTYKSHLFHILVLHEILNLI